jgi:hypothetical protein
MLLNVSIAVVSMRVDSDKTDYLPVWKRPNYYSSPAIAKCLDVCLASSGLTPKDINLFDFYSYVSRTAGHSPN